MRLIPSVPFWKGGATAGFEVERAVQGLFEHGLKARKNRGQSRLFQMSSGLSSPERRCDAFARAGLMPQDVISPDYP